MSSNHQQDNTPENDFQHQCVRDLVWTIVSPPLVSGIKQGVYWWNEAQCQQAFDRCRHALKILDRNPQALQQHLAAVKSRRLGHRFEALINFWLQLDPRYEVLAQNHQIIVDGKTLGEIDFIIKDLQSNEIIHLEVAVKFYLGCGNLSDPYRWFGTNTKDQLGKKLDHLQQHQTCLSVKYSNLFPFKVDKRHCMLKGRLFYPLTNNRSPSPVNPNHLKGHWFRSQDLMPINFESSGYVFLERFDMLARLSAEDIEGRELLSAVCQQEFAKCSVRVSENNQEIERVYILPDGFRFPN